MVHEHFYSGINPTEKIPAKVTRCMTLNLSTVEEKKKKHQKHLHV